MMGPIRMSAKKTKAEHARRLPSICVHVTGFYSSETGEWLAFVLDEQFNFIPMSERLHNCLAIEQDYISLGK